MAVQDREYMKEGEAPPAEQAAAPTWLSRLNEYGERHAKVIITVSTALIVLTVLVFAKVFYDEARVERAEQELAQAQGIEALVELKKRYGDTPVAPKILYRLANRYYEEQKLTEARREYEELKTRFPDSPIRNLVDAPLESLEKNLTFREEELELLRKTASLQTHPRRMLDVDDDRIRWGPVAEPNPFVELDAGTGTLKIELYRDEAPAAVEHFLKLAGEKFWEGVALSRTEDLIGTAEKDGGGTVPFEKTTREAGPHALVLVPREGGKENEGGRFQILLRPRTDPPVTVFGRIVEGVPNLVALKEGDAIKSVKEADGAP